MAMNPPSRASAAFHYQQAIEKLLKGFLVLAGKRSRKTHALEQLGAAARASFPDIADLVAVARNWSGWAVDYRYPPTERPRQALAGGGRTAERPSGDRPAGDTAASGTAARHLTCSAIVRASRRAPFETPPAAAPQDRRRSSA